MKKNTIAVFCLLAALSPWSRAAEITLYFSGVTQAGSPASLSIPAGTPFTGSYTFDPTTPNSGAADPQHRNFNDPLSTFTFHIGSGLYDFTTTSVGIEVDHNYGANFGGGDVFWAWANSQTITGTGQAANPIFNNITATVLLWRKASDGLFATANVINEPPMETLGNWDFAGIDLSILQGGSNSEHYLLSFSTISQTPPTLPPTITKSFGPSTIALGGTSSLTFNLTNPNASGLTGVGFTDTLPSGVTVSTGSSSTCGGTLTTTSPSTIVLSGAVVVAGTSCTFSVTVTGATAGAKVNTTGAVTSVEGGSGGTAAATLNVDAPPTVSKAFGLATVPVSGTTSLTFTITNPGGNPVALTGVGLVDTLPSGLTVPNATTAPCGGTLAVASNVITLSGATVAVGTPCTFSVTVTATTAGTFNNTTNPVTSTTGGTGTTASASLNAISSPVISESFSPTSVFPGSTSSLTITITDPGGNPTLTGVAFSEPLPAGLTAPNASASQCGGTLAVAGNTITLSGATVAVGTPCTFSVTVTAQTVGTKNAVSNNVTSTNGGTGNSGAATLNVLLTGTPAPSSLLLLGTALLALLGWSGWRSRRGRSA